MLVPFDVVKESILQNRCVFSRTLLVENEEFIFSRSRVPSLYADKLSTDDKAKIKDLVKVLLVNASDLKLLFKSDRQSEARVRSFFGKCITHGDSGDEAILHAYMYIFWQDIAEHNELGRALHSNPRWGSKEFGLSNDLIPGDEKLVAVRMQKKGVEVDLFTCESLSQTIALIELKRGPSDDRSVGQLLRYYQLVWSMLSESEFRRLNINYIWPILVVNKMRPEDYLALPVHFRGLLDILVYEIDILGIPRFSNFKRAAITDRWG